MNASGAIQSGPEERILVVDDDPDIRDTIADILRDEGYTVDAVASGADALDYLQSNPKPCLVLLDLMMPGMSGEELAEELRKTPQTTDLTIAVLSAARDVEESAQRMQAVAYLRKPISLDGLIGLVSTHC